MKQKTLLIIGGGLLQLPVVKIAHEMALKTIVADMNPKAPGIQLADDYFIMSTKDVEGMVRMAKKYNKDQAIHAVITAGTDATTTVAAVANALELPGIRYVDAEAATNKIKMRKRLKKFGVPIPEFLPIWSIQDVRDALDFLKFPLVLKPSDNMGARGVIRINNAEQIQKAFQHAKKYSPTGEMILEEYMSGQEVSIDALIWNGNVQIVGIADRLIEKEPYFIEIGHNMPSQLSPEIRHQLEQVMKQGMKALGLNFGAAKGDIILTEEGIKVVEIAGRLSGEFMSAYTYPLSTGVFPIRAAIQIALGETPDSLQPLFHRVAIERSLFARPGKLISISGLERARKIVGVKEIFIHHQPGDMIVQPTNNLEKSGHVIIEAQTLKQAEQIFTEVQECIEFKIDDIYSVNEKSIAMQARKNFGRDTCWVCKICDGKDCASGVPGMGGVGKMLTFQDNINALREISIQPSYIRENIIPTIETKFLQTSISLPAMAAPMTGAVTNMNSAIDEAEYANIVMKGCLESGTLAWLGDGASPQKYHIMIDCLQQFQGRGVLICKPRQDEAMLKERFVEAERVNALAVGMDIDAIRFKTMELKQQSSVARDVHQLGKIRSMTKLPFILKGILSKQDAQFALEVGADAIVVSNHGGRISDSLPGSARVLPSIKEVIGDKITILVDGGVRSGGDIFKMLALGADLVLVGRPVSIYAIGGKIAGVKFLFNQFKNELSTNMGITACRSIEDINSSLLFFHRG